MPRKVIDQHGETCSYFQICSCLSAIASMSSSVLQKINFCFLFLSNLDFRFFPSFETSLRHTLSWNDYTHICPLCCKLLCWRNNCTIFFSRGPFPPLPVFFFFSECDLGDGVGKADSASLLACGFALGLGGSAFEGAAGFSFLFFVLGAAVFKGSSTSAGGCPAILK